MPHPELHVLVCTNERDPGSPKPCCGARGSLELYRALKDRIRQRGLRDRVLVTRTGCLRHCSRGPTVVIWPGNTWLGGVLLEDADALLDATLEDEPLEGRSMPPGPWE